MAPRTRSQSTLATIHESRPSTPPLTTTIPPTTNAKPDASAPPKRTLKRSASLASLPTPPRTRRNPRSSRSSKHATSSSDSDTEEAELQISNAGANKDQKRRKVVGPVKAKGRAESIVRVEEEDEDSFWLDVPGPSSKPSADKPLSQDEGDTREDDKTEKGKGKHVELRSPSPEPLTLEQKRALRSSSSAEASLASPPPSRRHPPAPAKRTAPLPVTPKKQKIKAKTLPLLRDSPENPFLSSDEEEQGDLPVLLKNKDKAVGDQEHSDPDDPRKEKPTVVYVFRGKRAKFSNPHYVPPNESPSSKEKREYKHKLPLDHPDYSPDTRCPPRKLFTERIAEKKAEKSQASASSSAKLTTPVSLSRVKTENKKSQKTILIPTLPTIHSDEEDNEGDDEEEEEEDLFDASRVAKRLFVDGVGKGSVDAGMAVEKTERLLVRPPRECGEDDVFGPVKEFGTGTIASSSKAKKV